jgi:hypothetical protein
LGPSLSPKEAKKILSSNTNRKVTYAPPIKRGDIPNAINEGFNIIGIVDGFFFRESAVSPREIMEALKDKVKIYGASSMGALRASELDRYGMIGIGKIYHLYRDGTLNSDDEVALSFESEGYTPLSEPLINIRETIKKAFENNVLNKEEYEVVFKSAKNLYFPERRWEKIIQNSENILNRSLSNLTEFVKSNRVDIKREDAILLLKRINEDSK